MKDTWNKLKENYGKNLPEIALMCVFLCASLALNASKIADSSKEVFGRNVNRPEGEGQAEEVGEKQFGAEGSEAKGLRAEGSEMEGMSPEGSEIIGMSGEGSEIIGVSAENSEMIRISAEGSDMEEMSSGDLEIQGPSVEGSELKSLSAGGRGTQNGSESGKGQSSQYGTGRYVETDEVLIEAVDISRLYDLADFTVLEQCPPVYPPRYYSLLQPQMIQKIPGPDRLVEYYGGENPARNFSLLKKMLENRIAGFDGDWSVYVKNLSTQESLTVNDRPMKSASVMKLFIMGAVYRAMEAGELARTDEVMALLDNMVRVSDNDSSNQLLYMLGDSSYEAGIQEVNDFIAEYGFSDLTIEYNGFNSEETLFEEEKFNQVSAEDCGKLLEDIYHRNWVNRKVSSEIENMLLGQTTRYKIPAGLPEGVLCGNKTGEMDTTENDAAIVYTEHCDYILVVLSSDWSDGNEAISEIVSISQLVYEFLNN